MLEWYARVIRALCEQAGIKEWQAIIKAQQLEANGYIVALVPLSPASTTMVLYVELTGHSVVAEAALLRSLLESNIYAGESSGAFALIPGRGTVAYRMRIAHADTLTGESLMSRILDLIARATSEFHCVMARHAGREMDMKIPTRIRTSPLQKRIFA